MKTFVSIVCLTLTATLLSGCAILAKAPLAQLNLQPSSIASPAFDTAVITTANATAMTELRRLDTHTQAGVWGLTFTPDGQQILAVTGPAGMLWRWGLPGGKLLGQHALSTVGLGSVSFDAQAKLVSTGTGVGWRELTFHDEYLGYRIWDTTSGRMVHSSATEPSKLPIERFLYPRLIISPDGQWLLGVSASADEHLEAMKNVHEGKIWSRPKNSCSDTYLDRMPEEDDFDVIALDAAADLYAVSDQTGQVRLFPFRPPRSECLDSLHTVEDRGPVAAEPLALAFDPQRRWLARVRDTELVIWDLSKWGYPRQLEDVISPPVAYMEMASLVFDPSGTLLAVGSRQGLQLWDVLGKRKLIDVSRDRVFAFAFSTDGKLFAYGDAKGVVHVLGVRN